MNDNTQTPQSKSVNQELLSFLPNMPNSMPQEEYDYTPPLPRRKFFLPIVNPVNLARRIYLNMLRAIKDYGDLENIAPDANKPAIRNLQSQMQILSLSMLNIYQNLNGRPRVPFYMSQYKMLSANYNIALQEMYDRVYLIYAMVLKLFRDNPNESLNNTLLVILSNLKSQLRTLNGLKI